MFAEQSNTHVRMALGERVRAHRKARKLTQQQLADRAGLSRPTLSNLERGHDVSLDSFLSVLRALDLLGALDAAVLAPAPSPIEALAERRGRVKPASTKGWAWGDES